MRWQQRVQVALAAFVAGFVVLLLLAVRPGRPRESAPPPDASTGDPAASAASTSGDVVNLLRDIENFRLSYDRLLTYPDGRQKLTGARILVPRRRGRDYEITAREAEVGPGQDLIAMQGEVRLGATDGLAAGTDAATFSRSEGVLRAPGPASFSKGGMSGSSVGLTYDQARDVMWLLDKAVTVFAPERAGEDGAEITAGAAVLARNDHYARYERGFTLVSGARRMSSDAATAYLTADGARVESLDMRGRSRVTGLGEGPGSLGAMEADDITLEFTADGKALGAATLASRSREPARLDLGSAGAGHRRVSGRWIDIRFAPDGATVRELTVRESVRLDLPEEDGRPAQTITAASLVSRAAGGGAIDGARFDGGVEYREASAPHGRLVRARALEITTAPGLGALDDARFDGGVRFEEDRLRGAAERARYLVAGGRIVLEGTDGTTGQVPRATDGSVAIDAARIELALEPRSISARGDVRTAMAPAPAGHAGAAKREVRRAGLLDETQPVFAASTALEYDGAAGLAVYTAEAPAQARLWQGDTTIQGDRLSLDDATGRLSAKGRVASTILVEQTNERTGAVERVHSVGSADEFLYEDDGRRATYTGSAHVSGPQGDLRASTIEVYLAASSRELERVEAYASVFLQEGARRASGDRLTYATAAGRYLMIGSPVKIEAECRETTGRSLTFYKSTNNILVEPNEEFRTQVRTLPNCTPGRD
ncbi:MAG TPA: LptA/OstA family protein [Vicinamibacterales bacterium]|nr:LptA/OstA family protein [Vicinamibacterales bacterium]HPW21901.1 LptA/OstA family protein [Vicinamibacterales bacterium]